MLRRNRFVLSSFAALAALTALTATKTASAQTKVLISTCSDADNNGVIAQLQPILGPTYQLTGTIASNVNAGTLATQKGVLIASDNCISGAQTTVGNALATYVDQGGGVVETVFTQQTTIELLGTWTTGNYRTVTVQNNQIYTSGAMGMVFDPLHPIAQGVQSISVTTYR